ncbi:MAG TPA: electron transport complex subunit RsxE [Treponemataceae bacterium]|nr:electron transport complex subunit RsxE [Treponemataceae bacterium]
MNKNLKIFTNGIIRENPLLILMIGLCSALAVTTNVFNGIGMSVGMTFVIVMSELIISLFRKIIPESIRIPVFIIVIATFVTIVDLVLQAYFPTLSKSLGVFIALIVVNCIIMGRVESFASKKTPGKAVLDALGMGLGYSWVLIVISIIREFLGFGTFFGIRILPEAYTVGFFKEAPGGFFVFGLLIAVTIGIKKAIDKKIISSKAKKGAH